MALNRNAKTSSLTFLLGSSSILLKYILYFVLGFHHISLSSWLLILAVIGLVYFFILVVTLKNTQDFEVKKINRLWHSNRYTHKMYRAVSKILARHVSHGLVICFGQSAIFTKNKECTSDSWLFGWGSSNLFYKDLCCLV